MASKIIIVAAIVSALIALAIGISLYYGQTTTSPTEKEQQTPNISGGNSGTAPSGEPADIILPSPYAKEFLLPKDSWPNGIVVDGNGTVWTVGSRSHDLISLSSKGAKSFALPINETTSLMVWTMIADRRDGSISFSGSSQNPVMRFDPRTEVFQSTGQPSATPMQMKDDKGGNIWYTLRGGAVGVLQELGRRGSHIYESQEQGLGKDSFPSGLFLQNNTLWVTKALEGKMVLFNITYAEDGRKILGVKKIGEFPQQGTLVSPTDIIIDNNGSAWLTEHETSFLTEFNIKTQQVIRYPTALHPIQITTLPYWLAEDPSGKGVWFNEHRGNRIAYFDFANHTMTEYEVPTRNPQMGYIANVLTIAADPTNTNRAWFTEFTEDKIGYIDRSVPIPFDIHTSEKQIVVEKWKTATVNIDVTRNPYVELFNNTLSFNVSSSSVMSGVLLNATADFSPSAIDLSKLNGTQAIKLELKDEGIQKGQYILAISATDGAVIRTVYLEFVVN